MAIYGNKNTGEITPNNFATRPGVIPGKIASAPSTDYLFGSNLGILQEENNLSISKATIRSAIPRPFMLGSSLAEPTFGEDTWLGKQPFAVRAGVLVITVFVLKDIIRRYKK
tara:strand:- start:149 stop:484 length:336 start_codon:yes stop_codon:yes gene_type:complete